MLSIIICSIDQRKFDAVSSNYAALLKDESFEVIGIHDARSLAEGYNRGIARSSGETLIFSHDDIEILSTDFAVRLRNALTAHDLVGVAGTSRLVRGNWVNAGPPYVFGQIAHLAKEGVGYEVFLFGAPRRVVGGIQALDGVFLAARREALDKVRFDEATFDGFHLYDLDFSFSAYQAGLRLAVTNDIHLIHTSHGSWDGQWAHYMERFLAKFPSLPATQRRMRIGRVAVRSREEILEVMNPGHFGS